MSSLLAQHLKPGMRVHLPGCSGQSTLFDKALQQAPDLASGITFCGVFIPGINTTDYAALHAQARMEVIFMQPAFRDSYAQEKVNYLPLPYSNTYHYYETGPSFDIAFIQVSPPNKLGYCSFGIAADFSPAAIRNARKIIAHINPTMPQTHGPAIHVDELSASLTAASDLLTVASSDTPDTLASIALQIAEHIDNGATLQLGLGKLQQAMLECLTQHRRLKIHAGMISDPVMTLVEHDALSQVGSAITTGVALGTQALYDFCAAEPNLRFAPVGFTHQAKILQQIDGLNCINSAIEVDLLGQANGETLDGRQVSGTGGLVDFGRGARLAKGGRFILATPATASNGKVSRIVPQLCQHTPVSVARQDIDWVVTEYGIADLRYLGVNQRAKALINIAAPQFRESLSRRWRDEMQQRL